MSVLDRFRSRLRASGGLARTSWDDGDAGDLAALVTTLAAAWDCEPGDPRAAASRAAVLGRFATDAAAGASTAGRASASALPVARVKPGIGRSGPRPALVLVSAGLLLAMAIGTAAASAPGGPLYGLRVTSEELLLPARPTGPTRSPTHSPGPATPAPGGNGGPSSPPADGGSGRGSPEDGGASAPQPSSGSGQGGGGPVSSATPGGRP